MLLLFFFFFKQKTAYEMRISDWSSDVCSSDLKMRRHCVPLPDYAVGFVDRWFERAAHPDRGLLEAIGADMWEQVKVRPLRSDFKPENLPAHLFMNFKVVDEHGRMLSGGRNLDQLKAEHGRQAQASLQKVAARDDQIAPALDRKS